MFEADVLICALVDSDIKKPRAPEPIVRKALGTAIGCITSQMVQGCANEALRKIEVALLPDACAVIHDRQSILSATT